MNKMFKLFSVLTVLSLLLAGVVMPAMVTAAPGKMPLPLSTPRCFWENPCTPTPDPSQPTATVTATVDPSATATATPPLSQQSFQAPEFGIPTGIPDTDLNSLYPAPTPWNRDPLEAPSPIAITINPISTPNFPTITLSIPATYTVMSISEVTIPISLTITPIPITDALNIISDSVTHEVTDTMLGPIVLNLNDFTQTAYSYTNVLSNNIEALESTEAITIVTAPAWYAPSLPRPFADVGWTFEQQIGPDDTVPKFTTESWAAFVGYTMSLPFSFIRMIWNLLSRFGPFGLFLGWLFIMAIFVFTMELIRFIIRMFAIVLRLIVRLIEFSLEVILFIVQLIIKVAKVLVA